MTRSEQQFDVVIIGAGPGGYVAALRAAQLKLRTAVIERESLGGVCLNWGCIPTKALLHSADTLRRIRHADSQGIVVGEPCVDFNKMVARSRHVSQRLERGVTHLLHKAGVTVLMGTARIPQAGHVHVVDADGGVKTLLATHTIVATGARARELPFLPFDGDRVWGYRDALAASALPKTLIVVGAGAIGMEFASFYATLGTHVTVVEAEARVLPASDIEVSQFAQQQMTKDGIQFLTGAKVQHGEIVADGVTLMVGHASGTQRLHAERVLVAVGLVGNSENLGLEHTGAVIHQGLMQTGHWGATEQSGLYAIGDITGAPMLAHKASHDGIACVEHIAGLRNGVQHHSPIPACVYSHPQSASVGLTEEQARAKYPEVRVGKFSLDGNGKALAIDDAVGFIKTIFDANTGELLGAHLIGPESTELVHGYTLAASLEATEEALMETIFPHPTLSEAMHEAVLAAYGRALHR